jgi:hypothetical protein
LLTHACKDEEASQRLDYAQVAGDLNFYLKLEAMLN